MDPHDQMQSNMARMKAAAQARKSRPLGGMVSSTGADKTRQTASGSLTGSRPSTLSTMGPTSPSSVNAGSPSVGMSLTSFGTVVGGNQGGNLAGSVASVQSSNLANSTNSSVPEDETQGQERIRKQLERVGIAPTMDTANETFRPDAMRNETAKLDVTDTRSFLGQPPPKVGMIQCYILREKSNLYGNKYSLYLEDRNIFLLASVKRKKNKTSNYLISLDKDDLNRDSGHFYGKVRSNFVGTEFTVYDKGEKPTKDGNTQSPRQEIGAVIYEPNILGTKGPRKMCCCLPAVDENGKRSVWKPEKEDEGLIHSYKQKDIKDMMILRNKEPSWNEQIRAYVLNFDGRVTMASVKNFQLVDQDNPGKVLMQFGKVEGNKFTLDFQYPISGLQAFGIALSAFDGKLACE